MLTAVQAFLGALALDRVVFRLVPCKLYIIDLVLWHVYFSGFAVKFARLRDGKDLVKT